MGFSRRSIDRRHVQLQATEHRDDVARRMEKHGVAQPPTSYCHNPNEYQHGEATWLWKFHFLMAKSSINDPVSVAMLVCWRLTVDFQMP